MPTYQDNAIMKRKNQSMLAPHNREGIMIQDSELIWGSGVPTNRITFVVPIHGLRPTLGESLLSIINQDWNDDIKPSILISNSEPLNESGDEVINILKALNYKGIIVSYFRAKKEIGMTANFNRAFYLSTSKYVCVLHDDDLLAPNYSSYLIRAINLLERNPGAAMILANYHLFKGVPRLTAISTPIAFGRVIPSEITIEAAPVKAGCAPTCGAIYRKKCFLELGGFDETFSLVTDLAYIYKAIGAKRDVWYPSAITGYYRNENNTSSKPETYPISQNEKKRLRKEWAKQLPFLKSLYVLITIPMNTYRVPRFKFHPARIFYSIANRSLIRRMKKTSRLSFQ